MKLVKLLPKRIHLEGLYLSVTGLGPLNYRNNQAAVIKKVELWFSIFSFIVNLQLSVQSHLSTHS